MVCKKDTLVAVAECIYLYHNGNQITVREDFHFYLLCLVETYENKIPSVPRC